MSNRLSFLVGSDQGTKGQTMSVIELSWTDKKIYQESCFLYPKYTHVISHYICLCLLFLSLAHWLFRNCPSILVTIIKMHTINAAYIQIYSNQCKNNVTNCLHYLLFSNYWTVLMHHLLVDGLP